MESSRLSKQAIRNGLQAPSPPKERPAVISGIGQAAERLRRLPIYREARHVFCSPVADLFQIRLNGLSDGKLLTIATPGLTKGFLRLDPTSIPASRRFQAARLLPEALKGMKLPFTPPPCPPIDLIVADVLAADLEGHLLGDGSGHLDLQVAILHALSWLSPKAVLVAIVPDRDILPAVPTDETDVRAHWIVSSDRAARSSLSGFPPATVRWDKLEPRRIRRNGALFHLSRSLRDTVGGFRDCT